MLATTKPNCASKPSASAPLPSKPGMPETNSRSPVRAANESGGDLTPAGGAKCWIGAMGHLHEQVGASRVQHDPEKWIPVFRKGLALTRRCLAGRAAARRVRPADSFEGSVRQSNSPGTR